MSLFFSMLRETIQACDSMLLLEAESVDYSALVNLLSQTHDRIQAMSDDITAMQKLGTGLSPALKAKINNMKLDLQKSIRNAADIGKLIELEKAKEQK